MNVISQQGFWIPLKHRLYYCIPPTTKASAMRSLEALQGHSVARCSGDNYLRAPTRPPGAPAVPLQLMAGSAYHDIMPATSHNLMARSSTCFRVTDLSSAALTTAACPSGAPLQLMRGMTHPNPKPANEPSAGQSSRFKVSHSPSAALTTAECARAPS